MAIKRVDPKATFRVVSQADDAVVQESPEEIAALKASKEKSRYDKFTESLAIGDLQFKEGVKPTYFHIRALLNSEKADIEEKYLVVDVEKKKITFKNQKKMLLEMFELGCVGIEDERGVVAKVVDGEIPYDVAIDIGSLISIATSLGKNLKKA